MSDLIQILKGGSGSGDFGHTGRAGKRGGSGGGGGKGKPRKGRRSRESLDKEIEAGKKKSGGKAVPSKERPKDPRVIELRTKFVEPSRNDIGTVDENVAKKIADRSGISETVVKEYIQKWNVGNTRARILFTEAIRQEFGSDLSDYEKINYDKDIKRISKNDDIKLIPDYKKISRAIYDETQEQLKNSGVSEVTMYRGMTLDKRTLFDLEVGNVSEYHANSLESWTIDYNDTKFFRDLDDGVAFSSTYPVNRIFSMPTSGIGTSRESEFLILGIGPNDVVHITEKGAS